MEIKKPKEWLAQTLANSAVSYALGTLDSYSTHWLLRGSEEVADKVCAPDNLLNAAAVVVPYLAIKSAGCFLENRRSKVLKWTGRQIQKYAGLLATVPAIVYEVVEAVAGKGMLPQSSPTSLGTMKDIAVYLFTGISLYTFDRAMEKYKESQRLDAPAIIKSPDAGYTSLE